MAIKINFDSANVPEMPTIILGNRNGEKLGLIPAKNIVVKGSLKEAAEISFCVYKYEDGVKTDIWNQIVNSRVIWCKEWDMWFDISVEINESDKTMKNVSCIQLGQAELSQTNLYNIEINTENDIARDDYKTTKLFDETNPKASLLNRILEKAPHYSISHVDPTIANIQRTFTFDDISIYDAFQKIAEEINALFIFNSNSDENGKIVRSVAVYDLQQNCNECGYRGDFTDKWCPKCESNNITEGYGHDTAIFITADELANEIQLTTDMDSVKNCYKLEGGDDLMTATIRNCNPNGSDYLWHFSDATKSLMSRELSDKIDVYEAKMRHYQDSQYGYTVPSFPNQLLTEYNKLIYNYNQLLGEHSELIYDYHYPLNKIPSEIIGYQKLMECYYNAIDFEIYLQSSLMPNINLDLPDTNAKVQAKLLEDYFNNNESNTSVSVTNIKSLSESSANSVVLSVAKIIVDSRYRVKIAEGSLANNTTGTTWKGKFIVTNYSDTTDTKTTGEITIAIKENYESFVQQKVELMLHDKDSSDCSISGLFSKDYVTFCGELKKYCMDSLKSFYEICQSVIDILIKQGVTTNSGWTNTEAGSSSNLYEVLYIPYRDKLNAIQEEIDKRQNEINIVSGIYDENEILESPGVKTFFEKCIKDIQSKLNFEKFFGVDLWKELCSYRREEKYSNTNFISDGLNNAELIKKSMEFMEGAKEEIYKSSELQHSISAPLKNLLIIDKFAPLVESFETGNRMRIKVDDVIYELRLTQFEINYDDLNNISVEFSNVTKPTDHLLRPMIIRNIERTFNSSRYRELQGAKGNILLDDLLKNGFDIIDGNITNNKNSSSGEWDYSPCQLKLSDSALLISDDNWNTSKMVIGLFHYLDEQTGQYKPFLGINTKLINGKELDISENKTILDKIDSEIENHPESVGAAWNKISDCIRIKTNDNADAFYFYDSNQNLLGSLGVVKSENPEIQLDNINLTNVQFEGKKGVTGAFQIISEIQEGPDGNILPIYSTITVENGIITDIETS